MTLTAELWNEANDTKVGDISDVGTIDNMTSSTVSGRKNALGLGELVIRNDHPLADGFTAGRHIRWYEDATLLHTTWMANRHRQNIGRGRNGSKVTTVRSVSHMGAWKKGFVRPYGGEDFRPVADDRSLGPHSPEVDLTSWSSVVVQYEGIASPISGVPGFEPWVPPDGWPESIDDVDWIFVDDSIDDDPPVFPSGKWVMRGTFTNPTTQDLWFCLSADDSARLFVDGVEVIPWTVRYPGSDSFRKVWRQVVPDVTSGSHHWSIELEVYPGTPSGPRRGMGAAAVHSLPASGEMLDGDTFIAGTDGSWKCKPTAYDFPSCNPHQVVSALLTAAQGLDLLTGWSLTSTASVDSDGQSWPTPVESAFRIGDNLFSVLEALVSMGALGGFRADPDDLTMNLYAPGNMGSASSAEYTPGVNIQVDGEDTDLDCTNLLIVRKEDGFVIEEDTASQTALGATFGESLSLPKLSNPNAIGQAADAVFDLDGSPKRSRQVAIAPSDADDKPGTGFVEGDTVTIGAETLTCQMWQISKRGKGHEEYQIEVDTARQVDAERTGNWLRSLGQGTLSGRSAAAILPTNEADPLPSGLLARKDFPVYSPDNDPDTLAPVTGTQKRVRNGDGQRRVTLFEVKGVWTPDEDIDETRTDYVAAVQRNGTNIAVITLTPDDSEKIVLVEDGLFLETDEYGCAAFGGVGLNDAVMTTTAVEAI